MGELTKFGSSYEKFDVWPRPKIRDYSGLNAYDFIDDLQTIKWNDICNHNDVNQSFSRSYKCVLRSISDRMNNSLLNHD